MISGVVERWKLVSVPLVSGLVGGRMMANGLWRMLPTWNLQRRRGLAVRLATLMKLTARFRCMCRFPCMLLVKCERRVQSAAPWPLRLTTMAPLQFDR